MHGPVACVELYTWWSSLWQADDHVATRISAHARVQVRAAAKAAGAGETQDALYAFWLERVRTNLHVILCLSPVGEAFRERCRMFPGLVNCTTIDW